MYFPINKSFAASIDCNMEIQTSKAEYSKGEEFVANVYISDIKSETGIIALQAVLDYDKSNLTLFRYGWKKWLGYSRNKFNL